MSLSTQDRQLLRKVFAWSRENGWRRDKPQNRYSEDRLYDLYCWQLDAHINGWVKFCVDIEPEGDAEMDGVVFSCRFRGWVRSVREAVDVLAASRILPVELSSVYVEGYGQGRDDEAAGV